MSGVLLNRLGPQLTFLQEAILKQTNAHISQKEREELLLKDYKQERHYQQITELALE